VHYAARFGAPLEVVEVLTDLRPEARKERTALGRRFAAARRSSQGVRSGGGRLPSSRGPIRRGCSRAKWTAKEGFTPRCFGRLKAPEWRWSNLLASAWGGAVQERDAGGVLPLHHAAVISSVEVVVEFLTKAYPDALREKGGGRRLHTSCTWRPETIPWRLSDSS
jgi:hypothetical protein